MAYADPVKAKEYKKAYNQRDYVKVKKNEYNRGWVKRNYEIHLKNQREYNDANREKSRAKGREYLRKYRKENPDYLEKGRTYFKAYRQRDYVKVKSAEYCSKRRVEKIRTSKFELNNYGNTLKLFKLSRKKTKETGKQYHVDHIIPLRGKGVSGFNVAGNLRIVLAHNNMSKNNRYTARDEALIQRRMVKDWIANGVDFKLYKPKKKRKAA